MMRMFDVSKRLARARWLRRALAAVTLCGMLVSGAALASAEQMGGKAFALLRDCEGEPVGIALFEQKPTGRIRVWVQAWNLEAGFHGLHLHETGLCIPPDFTSAGGHFNPEGTVHPNHAGDFPSLLVMENGQAFLTFWTDRFLLDEALDSDGAALIVHDLEDNYGNIPGRYLQEGEEIDAITEATGDSGPRIACGVLRPHLFP